MDRSEPSPAPVEHALIRGVVEMPVVPVNQVHPAWHPPILPPALDRLGEGRERAGRQAAWPTAVEAPARRGEDHSARLHPRQEWITTRRAPVEAVQLWRPLARDLIAGPYRVRCVQLVEVLR